MIKDEYRQFLLETLHTDAIRHSGRSLYTHLAGTHDLLEGWHNPPHVCAAGLFHSIYGTRHFRHQSWPLDRRAPIIELIGPEAELLAYVFCVTGRPKELIDPPSANGSKALYNSHKKEMLALSPETLRMLREIEAANLLEQGSGVGHWLKALSEQDISAGAKSAIAQRTRREQWG